MKIPSRIIIYIHIVLFILSIPGINAVNSQEILKEWSDFSSSQVSGEVIKWLKQESYNILSKKKGKDLQVKCPEFYGRYGVFITIIKGNKVRGCYGAFTHRSHNLNSILKEYLKGSLRLDNRYKPLGIEELKGISIILTVTTQPYQFDIKDLEMLDISNYGIIFHNEMGGQTIFVPAEIKTHSYMMNLIKTNKVVSVSSFKAVTIK